MGTGAAMPEALSWMRQMERRGEENFLSALWRNFFNPQEWHLLHLPPGHTFNIPSMDNARFAADKARYRIKQAAAMADARAAKVPVRT